MTAPSPVVSAVISQDDLEMQDAFEADLDSASPSTIATVESVDISMEDTKVEDMPGLDDDDDSIVSNTEDDNNDPGDDNISLTHMQRLSNQKVAKFDREHPPKQSSRVPEPVHSKGAKNTNTAEAAGPASGNERAALTIANVNNLPVDGMVSERSESPGRKSDDIPAFRD